MKVSQRPFAISGWSRARRYVWLAILALSPLAYFAATRIQDKLVPQTRFVSIHRQEAIAAARAFALGLHLDAQNWPAGTLSQGHKLYQALLRRQHPAALLRIAAPATIAVSLREPSGKHWITVNLTPDGRVTGFLTNRADHQGQPPGAQASKAAADAALRYMLGPGSPFVLSDPVAAKPGKQGWEREFDWQSPVPGMARGKADFHVATDGGQVYSASSSLKLDADYEHSLDPENPFEIAGAFFIVIYYMVLGSYALIRYVKRSMEKEISHFRTILLILIFLSVGLSVGWFNGTDTPGIEGAPPGDLQKLAFLILVTGLISLPFGIAYGAGEGDLRETYPGTLSSLDAVLAGKIFSANFARSILAGGAVAGWILLIQNGVLWATHAAPIGNQNDLVTSALLKVPVATLAQNVGANVSVMIAFGILLPVTFLRPRIRQDWLFYSLLALFSGAVVYTAIPDAESVLTSLFLAALFIAAAWIPFFKGDLLAAISSVTALCFVGELVRRSAVSEMWHHIAYQQVLPAGVIFLAVELYFAWRGNVYDESEVRPRYARNLVERLALTAEIGAARQAQLRLLPDAPPRIAGLSIAGSLTPAREVGGDFFDYYALDDHRLGVFIAEGGNRELGSAMAIALAKGFVMYSARLDLSTVEMLRRLRSVLGGILHGEKASMTLLYAVINARTGALSYARAGVSPRLLINGAELAEAIVADPVDGWEIRHGAANLNRGDFLFFYTDGWSAQIAAFARRTPQALLSTLARKHPGATAEALHHAAIRSAGRIRREAPPDDVTAVVVCLEQWAAAQAGGIA